MEIISKKKSNRLIKGYKLRPFLNISRTISVVRVKPMENKITIALIFVARAVPKRIPMIIDFKIVGFS